MKRILLWMVLGTSSLALADGPSSPIPGWLLGERSRPNQNYTLSIDRSDAYSGTSSALLSSHVEGLTEDDVGSIVQFVDAEKYRGKRIRFSAALKTGSVKNWAAVWIRADGTDSNGGRIVEGESIQRPDQRPHGDTSWQRYSLVLDIPEDTTSIAYGAEVRGMGRLWLDSVQLELVGEDIPVTQKVGSVVTHFPPPQHKVLPEPANLDFEE